MLRAAVRQRLAEFELEYGDMAIERLDGEDTTFERIQESLQSLPFLVGRKLVVLQSPGLQKVFVEHAAQLLADVPDTTDVIIIEPKLDKRSTYYKFLKKQTGYKEYNELDESGLARWLVELAKQHESELTTNDARYLIGRVGTNQESLSQEIEKLSIAAEKISRTTINELTTASPQSTIFQLLEAALAGQTKRAAALYAEQRALRVEPQQIIAMLAWQLHILVLVKAAGDIPPQTIAKDAKLSPYVVQKSAASARKLTMAELRRLVADLLLIDMRLKSESLNADDVMLEYLLTMNAE